MEDQPNDLANNVTADVIANPEPAYRHVTGSLRQEAIAGDLQKLAKRITDSSDLQKRMTLAVAAGRK